MRSLLFAIILLTSLTAQSQDIKLLKRISFAFSYDEVEKYCRDAGFSFQTAQKQTGEGQCDQYHVFEKSVSYYRELVVVISKCSDEALNPTRGVRFMTRNADLFYRIKDECKSTEQGKVESQKSNSEGDLISTYSSGLYMYSFTITNDHGVKAYIIEVTYNRPF